MIEEVIENVKEINENNDLFGTYTKAKSILDFIELKENEKLLSENNLIAIKGAIPGPKGGVVVLINSKKA